MILIFLVIIGKFFVGVIGIGLVYWLFVLKVLELERKDCEVGIIGKDEYLSLVVEENEKVEEKSSKI